MARAETGKIMQVGALIGSVLIAAQVIFSLATGRAFCPSGGCRLVENLTVVSPLVINLLGLIYFQALFWSLRLFRQQTRGRVDVPGLLLLVGLAVEGVLLAYQLFVARAFCGYCLVVLVLVVVLNAMHGRRQQLTGAAVLGAVMLAFSLLTFMPARVFSQYYSLQSGSYGVKSCTAPSREIYLIVSSKCPHCKKVIRALSECNSCKFYLNPVDGRISRLQVEGLELNPSFSQEINRLMLAMLGIREVPVLVVKNSAGYSFIKGEEKILNYVRDACFNRQPTDQPMSLLTEDSGECTLESDCDGQ